MGHKINTSSAVKILLIVAIVGWGIYASIDDDAIEKNNNALSNFDAGNTVTAIQQLEDASKSAVTNDTKISTLKNLAYAYSSEGKEELSLNAFKEALSLTSTDSFDYFLISGEIELLEGGPTSALEYYNKAYLMNSTDFQINNALALFYMDLEELHPTFADHKKSLSFAQTAANATTLQTAKQNLGIAYFLNDQFDQAIATFSSLNMDTKGYTAFWLGLSYVGKKDSVNAKIYLQQAINAGVEVPQEIYDYIDNN